MKEIIEEIYVAPLVGAWIEIVLEPPEPIIVKVAPLVGAWIEIIFNPEYLDIKNVAPLVGAWIEIITPFLIDIISESLLL